MTLHYGESLFEVCGIKDLGKLSWNHGKVSMGTIQGMMTEMEFGWLS